MIITEQKEYKEILENLHNQKDLIILGCGLCATTTQTGGEKEVQELKKKLIHDKKNIILTEVIEPVCDERKIRIFLNKNKELIKKADAIVVLSCGAGVQSLTNLNPELNVQPGLNSLFVGTEKRHGHFNQFCSLCGKCILDITNGICPVTRCPKGYVNGPCGGSKHGKCEANPENDCVWEIISQNPIKKKLKIEIIENRDYNKQFHPRKIIQKMHK